MIASQMPFASRCQFRETFYSPGMVQANGGVITACTVSRGISPSGVSGRVTYTGSQQVLANVTQATWRIRYKTPAVLTDSAWLHKVDQTWGATLHWGFEMTAGGLFVCYLGAAAANFFRNAAHAPSTVYVEHFVYDGALAAGNRGKVYWNGSPQATTIGGVIPTSLAPTAYPVTVFNRSNGVNRAPNSDAVIYDVLVTSMAMSDAEVADDYADLTYREVVP